VNKSLPLGQVRNIGIAAHVDAGKTTLTERILYYTGASHKIGEVHEGAAHMDYLAEEHAHGITITAAVTKAQWRDHSLQIVDTPGHVDFTIEVERSMRILDGVILTLDGVRGVEPQTETVWRQRSRFNLPAILFVNKMDRPGADFGAALAHVRRRLKVEPVAVTLPLPEERAVIDLIDRTLIRFGGEQGESLEIASCPEELWREHRAWREALLLAVADVDEGLAEQVLEDIEPAPDAIRRALRAASLSARLFPTYGGSALRNLGVQPLLDGIVDFLPAPVDRPPATARLAQGGTEEIALGEAGPLVALAFKIQLWEGRRHVFVRIYRGRLRAGDRVALLTAGGEVLGEQVARIFNVDAGKKTRTDAARPGEIVLLAGLRHASTGDTLCAPEHVLALERIDARRPVLSMAIEPLRSDDSEKLEEVLAKLVQEDPTLGVEDDPETGQRLLKGMGELHLQIVLERLEREFHLRVRSGRPAVAAREAIAAEATAEALYARPPDPDRHLPERRARVVVRVRPLPRGAGLRIGAKPTTRTDGVEVSPGELSALDEGLRLALASGPLQGAPLDDLETQVDELEIFGSVAHPEVISAAAARAIQKALMAARPILLQPVMAVEVVSPEANLGAVLGDLQARHAAIHATERRGEDVTITGEVPLEQLLGYTTTLRSLTQGRGQFTMQFARFDRG